jgi:hypothetical protein
MEAKLVAAHVLHHVFDDQQSQRQIVGRLRILDLHIDSNLVAGSCRIFGELGRGSIP